MKIRNYNKLKFFKEGEDALYACRFRKIHQRSKILDSSHICPIVR